VQISFTDIPKVHWQWPEEHIAIDFTLLIEKSHVKVDCKLDKYKDEYMVELHRRAFDLARACANVAAFATGYGIYVIFEQFVLQDGTVTQLMFTSSPGIVAECTAFKMNAVAAEEKKVMEQILMLVMGDPALFMLLNDLIQCLYVPHVTPVNCGRVMDGLRKLIAPGDPKKAWPLFRNEMHVDEAYTKLVSDNSTEHRHGGHLRIDGPTTTEILKRTWIVMNRFLEFRKRGNKPLPVAEFPVLHG
jgi:hypothetical protein